MSHTKEIAESLNSILNPIVSPLGFKYFKSKNQLIMKTGSIANDIVYDITSSNGVNYSVAFYIGVQYRQVEELIASIEGRKVTTYNRTIFQYSMNIHSGRFPECNYSSHWFIRRNEDINIFSSEIVNFFDKFALPYLNKYSDIMEVRNSLSDEDKYALNLSPFKQVLAIDYLLNDKNHLLKYLGIIEERYKGRIERLKIEFMEFYKLFKGYDEEFFSDIDLF